MKKSNQAFTAMQHSMWAPFCQLTAFPAQQDGSVEERLSRLENDLAIRDLLNKYGYSYDAGDLEGVVSVFHDNCTLVNPRGTYVGTEAIRHNYQYVMSRCKFSFHHVTNTVVRLRDDCREAGLTAYFNCVIVLKSGALAGGSGTYAVGLKKTGNEWKIFECRITRNTNVNIVLAAAGEAASASSNEAANLPPQPTSSESSRDWIGPDAIA